MDFVGLEKFSLVDYEGKVATTLFFAGCNFRCPFCHNRLLVDKFSTQKGIPFEEIISFLKQRRGMIDAVVFSGGEVTLMPDLIDKVKTVKELGFLVKIDTNGTNPKVIKNLIDLNLVDYIAMDIKNSLNKYNLTTDSNIDINVIKESISLIINSGIDHEFRTTVTKEFHSMNDMEEICELIKGAKRMRIQKFVASENCINKNLNEVDESTAKEFVNCIKKTISDTSLRGY